jgi:hypothetical protein
MTPPGSSVPKASSVSIRYHAASPQSSGFFNEFDVLTDSTRFTILFQQLQLHRLETSAHSKPFIWRRLQPVEDPTQFSSGSSPTGEIVSIGDVFVPKPRALSCSPVRVFSHSQTLNKKLFQCEICKTVVPAGIAAQKVTLETRAVRYPRREKIYPPANMSPKKQRALLKRSPDRSDKEFEKWGDDPGGYGLEILREGLACPTCASQRSS